MRLTTLALTIAVAWAPFAHAAPSQEGQAQRYSLGVLLNNVALNAAAATRTATVDLDATARTGYDLAIFFIEHTNSAATTVTMTCTLTPTGDSASTPQECAVSSGLCTSTDASWSKTVSGNKAFPWRIDISGFPGDLKCVFAGASAGASDKVTVTGWLATK